MASLEGLTSAKIAKMVDHSMLHPAFTDDQLESECLIAIEYEVGAVCVKPYHTKRAAELLAGSSVVVSAVVAFPHGNSTTELKLAETRQVLEDGATEVDLVVNIGKVVDGDWAYVDEEIRRINSLVVSYGAILKVIFENDMLTDDGQKIRLCEICSKHKVAFVKTSTGYCYNKEADGRFSLKGATHHDLALMRAHTPPSVQVKAAGGVSTLEPVLEAYQLGATRFGLKDVKKLVEDARARFGE
ncbi:MAG: deoxyribose-phosphate aldolase [Propionibacteriaceae bacterium]|nr:deoxyribose-phosphate aldolase [Propionibacteriaceae bacterium]